ncbi:alcohol dehydrogenase 1-like [Anopheles nili]|uniref:alcohol dehydrogenase 1-like n=1 Tax=Anopheles nili TaxID=185578 RepID=UPI00237A991C|nr:alcohol dehydrogenase 1-like [Anopheles nili]
MSLAGKNAVVFGGCGGMGLSIGQHLLKAGVQKLFILDVVNPTIQNMAFLKEFNEGAIVHSKLCDITNLTQLQQVLQQDVVAALGTIDILVNTAGIAQSDKPENVININLLGVINTSLITLDLMSRAKGGNGGVIVNVASVAGFEPIPFLPIYCATKHGVVGFTRSLGVDPVYDETGVKFLVICPGSTQTKMYESCKKLTIDINALQQMLLKYKPATKPQSTDVVGACIVQSIVEGENGSTWICHNGKILQHTFPKVQFN